MTSATRRVRIRELVAVSTALAAGLVLLVGDPPRRSGGPPTLASAYPHATVLDLPVAPGTVGYEPLLVLDDGTTIATGRDPETDEAVLLQLAGAAGGAPAAAAGEPSVAELRRLPGASRPRFTIAADPPPGALVWGESTSGTDGATTEIWTAELPTTPPSDDRRPGQPQRLTADTGPATFRQSQHDLTVAEDQVHWAAASEDGTELRSVPLAGGPVRVRTIAGQWALGPWPWLVDNGGVGDEPVRLRAQTAAAATVQVPAGPGELVTCAARWCRVLVPATASEVTRIELQRPDGSDRQLVAGGGQVASPLLDVALQDQFEIWTVPGVAGSPVSDQQLMLYDLRQTASVQLATEVGRVGHGNGFLWWSTGSGEALHWRALDLRSLS
ncbi:hypothetical protein JQS43_23610 [Natronosporangium hydrolyticum]|uniref:Uncharacterized protein n=1 Tax=Natronosporangium hydrolyticum TaxID=2811111 RepID=A0A895YKR7_9ACTN|nr:hypothetical protein [Natronosporangium hydrolyticum]QSB14438.1 hypothetical protein JQS43_23610 [Natronosporangium hydrolyticum]